MKNKINIIVYFIIILVVFPLGEICFAETKEITRPPYLYEIYICKAITNAHILPKSFPVPGSLGREIKLSACRGEYVPASFSVHALNQIKSMMVTPTDLQGEGTKSTLPAGAVDIRVVKCWFQSGVDLEETDKCVLTPELLLKDDKLVYVDLQEKKNYVRSRGPGGEGYVLISGPDSHGLRDLQPKDSGTLQPVDINVASAKQFWVTVHVPADAYPGDYTGKLKLTVLNAPPAEITLRLRVLPFVLEKPALGYSIYYSGIVTKNGQGSISSGQKSPQQYEAEMRNLKAHGVEYPSSYQTDIHLLQKEMEIREKAGLPKGPFYSLGFGNGPPPYTAAQLENLKNQVKELIELAKKNGYEDVYVYGLDEASGDRLKSQRPAWNAVHEVGGKVFVACYPKAFEAVGDLLDLAILPLAPDPKEAAKYHGVGHQIFSYANPHVGREEPETYRRNYGLLLWKAGYDGYMDYAYQVSHGHIWNDFDNKRYRDYAFAYPTVDGVIDTIQWEGFRTAVDDVRYVTTLLKAIKEAKGRKPQVATAAQEWIENVNVSGDLDKLRSTIVEWTIKLQ